MANFAQAVRRIIREEDHTESGVVTDRPNDRGGLTKWGISQRAYPDLDIRSLSRGDAEAIYRRDYWEPIGGSDILDQGVAEKIVTIAVTSGVRRAGITLQRALRSVQHPVEIDGRIGPKTIGAENHVVDRHGEFGLLAAIRSEMAGFYRAIVAQDKTQRENLRGWENRAYSA